MFLLDVRPDPVPVGGVAGLALLVILILILVVVLIVGFVILLKLLQRRTANRARIESGNVTQPSSPNQ